MGSQTERINSPHNTKHTLLNSPHNTIQSANKLIGKRRNKNSTKNLITNLPNKPKQQKMTGFGFKSSQIVHDLQKDIFTTNGNTIQSTLESLQESQRNDYFGDKLTTKPNENLRTISLNINGLDLGKGDHSLLQLCINLQDKGVNLLCLTETNINWQRHYLVQKFSTILKKA